MIQQKLNDPQWRRKKRAITFLTAIPVFGWMGLKEMGRRSDQKELRRAGTLFGWLSGIALAFAIWGETIYWQFYNQGLSQYGETVRALIRAFRDVSLLSLILLAVLWLATFVFAMIRSDNYLKYLALKESTLPQRNPLVFDKVWRRHHLAWMVWSVLPGFSGLSLRYASYKMQDKKLSAGATLTIAITIVASVGAILLNRLYGIHFSVKDSLTSTINWLVLYTWIVCLLKSFFVKETYLDACAAQWEADTHRYPVLAQKAWRRSNSLWQIWTYFPVVGGIGIALAGLRGKKRKNTVVGVAFCMCSALLFLLTSSWTGLVMAVKPLVSSNVLSMMQYCDDEVFGLLRIVLYILPVFFGTMIRWETLRARAASLQGYSSEFDREVDMQTRMRARKIEFTPAPVQPEVKPAARVEIPKVPEARPEQPMHTAVATTVATAEAAPNTPVDINHATQAELMTLPGIGVVQAKQVLEYRAANGGFKSVDEFVEVLRIKPHFAVQIFQRATLGQEKAVDPKPASEGSTVRRRIDF